MPITNSFVLKVIGQLESTERDLITEAGNAYVDEVRRMMEQSPRGGRIYKRDGGRRKHKASAPGEPPAVDTGDLIRSIRARVQRSPDGWEVVISGSPKGRWLEYGTRRIRPRPAWRPALKVVQAFFAKREQAVAAAASELTHA